MASKKKKTAKKPIRKKKRPSAVERLQRELEKTRAKLAAAEEKLAAPRVLPAEALKAAEKARRAQTAAEFQQSIAELTAEGFAPAPGSTPLQMAIARADRLRQTPGKPRLENIRVEGGFIVAEDENGDRYRAYSIKSKVTGIVSLFFTREEQISGYESPENFLDTYGKWDEEGDPIFTAETHDVEFAFGQEE